MKLNENELKEAGKLITIMGSNQSKPPLNWQKNIISEYSDLHNVTDSDLHYIRNTFLSALNNTKSGNPYSKALSCFKVNISKFKKKSPLSMEIRNGLDNKYIDPFDEIFS